jgi:hypothetical protein
MATLRTVDASNINDLAICCHNAYATSSKLCFLVVLDGERLSAGKRCRRGLDNIHLDLDELPDFALHINELRCFSPAAIKADCWPPRRAPLRALLVQP